MPYKHISFFLSTLFLWTGLAAQAQVTPSIITLGPSQTQQFSVPQGAQITWAVEPVGLGGSITRTGLYTAPPFYATSIAYVYALSGSNTTRAQVNLSRYAVITATSAPSTPAASISVSPSSIYLWAGQSKQFTASLSGINNQQVQWSIIQGVGSISNGLYTTPSSVSADSLVTISATSIANPTLTASATIMIGPAVAVASPATPTPAAVSVSLRPRSPSLSAGRSRQFNASVNGTSSTAVTWSLSPNIGAVVNGLYTAPTTISAAQSVEITATSTEDPTQSATSTINLALSPVAAPPPPPALTSVSPAAATVAPSGTQQFSVQNLPLGTSVKWSINVLKGGITRSGLYTAPSSVATQQTITVTAMNASTQAVLGTASLTLQASPTLPLAPTLTPTSVGPATVTLEPSGTQQFSVQNLPTGTTVVWGISPTTGSITQSGSYTAPSSVATQQTITVTATNASTAAVLGTAALTLRATPATISVSPATATISPAGTQQFSVQNLPAGTSVTWSISVAKGSITQAGLYTAPSSLATQKTITVTATNSSTAAVLGTASLTVLASPSIGPATATVAPSGSQQFSVQNLPAGTVVMWEISPSTGSVTQRGLYTAPSSVATQQAITVTAMNASTATVLGTASLTLQASPAALPASTTITLPIEVVGPDGTTATASFAMPQGANLSGQLQLWMQIHNLKYETEASVQVNNSAWLPISTGSVTLLGNAAAFGGIGGGFHTLQMTLNLPAGAVTSGTNTITFRFNGTDGVTSGFRVLAFNVQSAGSNLLPSSLFVNDDPNNWQPPSTAASDIAAGLALYQGAALTGPTTGAIQAHCSDCHTIDGRDLKYFNYSNNSIEARAVFHGLTAQQGAQIASYIRSLNLPNPGTPWNPPYQPGPGLDSQPVANWAAGAGLDAVLDNDSQMQPYLVPGGSTAGWSASSYLNPRELPVAFQLPDWNAWLPVIHPKDAFGASFTTSGLTTFLSTLRSTLQPNSPGAYHNAIDTFGNWFVAGQNFLVPIETNAAATNWNAPNIRSKVYSVALWEMVKSWELNQEFGLEGMPQVRYGPKANPRGWLGNAAFNTSPNMLHIPAGVGIGNGSQVAQTYLAFVWYQTQLLLNDGQGTEDGNSPIDFGYVTGFIKNLFSVEAQLPGAMLQMEWAVKSLQEFTLTGIGPQGAVGYSGWTPVQTSMEEMVDHDWLLMWSATSPATQTTLLQAYSQAWFAQASQYTPQQYYQGGWASPNVDPATLQFQTTFGGQVWYSLPRLRFFGVDPNLTDQMAAWAATIWPRGKWSVNDTATCATPESCTSGY